MTSLIHLGDEGIEEVQFSKLCLEAATSSFFNIKGLSAKELPVAFKRTPNRLQLLPTDVLVTRVLAFLSERGSIAKVRVLSKYFNDLVLTDEAEHLWNSEETPFEFCIDTYCSSCMIKKKRKGCHTRVLSFMEKCPINKLQLHCFITDIPTCLFTLCMRKSITSLDLALTNKSNSPPLENLLVNFDAASAENGSYFPHLKELTLDSTHLQHVKLAGRARLLEILGRNLESLSFVGLSPTGVFSILSSRCPKLKKLRVDKAHSESEVSTYKNEHLEELELCRANFVLHAGSLNNFPRIKRLRFSPSFRCESAQLEEVIGATPLSLQQLSMEIPSAVASDVILAISRRLRLLESLSLQSTYEAGTISEEAFRRLGRQCLFLRSFELTSAKSVSDITIDAAAFGTLALFPSLQRLRLRCDDVSLACVPDLIEQSITLRSVVLWQRKKWLGCEEWRRMEAAVAAINERSPNTVVTLESVM
jgi:hypothetical protein